MMTRCLKNSNGFGLIEVLIIIITIGIMGAIAMQSMTALVVDSRTTKTEREMESLADAIVGDADISQGMNRSDFGYVGDVGSFPPNLDALISNPGGYTTWDGPYIKQEFLQDSTGFKTDEWGKSYSYSGGVLITSTGGNTTISKKIVDATSDYTSNHFNGKVLDASGTPPGATYIDSLTIKITIPNGIGGTITKSYTADSSGSFMLDSLPVGQHPLEIVYKPDVDTLYTILTILPRHKTDKIFKFASSYFSTSGSGGGGTSSSCPTEPVLNSGLILHWDFNDTTGQYAYDVSSNSNDGTLGSSSSSESSDPIWTENGKYCSGLYFDGSDDIVQDLNGGDYLNGLTEVTFTVWVKSDVTGQDRGIMFTKSPDANDENLGIRYDQSGLNGGASSSIKSSVRTNSGYNQVEGEANVQTTSWQHIAMVWESGTSIKIYVDGNLQSLTYTNGSLSGAISNVQKFMIGLGTKNRYWQGYMDDVRIYDRALSQAEIQTLAN